MIIFTTKPLMSSSPLRYTRFILLSCLLLAVVYSRAQYIPMADSAFVRFLKTTDYASCVSTTTYQLDTICVKLVNYPSLVCSTKNIKHLTALQYFVNVIDLECSNNPLTEIDELPPNLHRLWCSDGQLSSLPPLPDSVNWLVCHHNKITALPKLPSGLLNLTAYNNQLTTLPDLPDSLINLVCRNNNITQFPPLPARLIYLECSSNQLSTLPSLPNLLEVLWCPGNNITSFPPLPPSLNSFSCSSNMLGALPALPASLEKLDCSSNLLTALPSLPAGLKELECSQNQLNQLPELPASLTYISCANNDLTSLPALTAGKMMLNVDSNPRLNCLPPLKAVPSLGAHVFSIAGTGITCLPNYIQHQGYIPSIDTMPICDFINGNGCEVAWDISGSIFMDENSDCAFNIPKQKINTTKVNLYRDTTLVQSGYFVRNYSFKTDTGTYRVTVDTANFPFYVSCPAGGSATTRVVANDTFKSGINFGLKCKPGFDVGVRGIYARGFRPAGTTEVRIFAGDFSKRLGGQCANNISGQISLEIGGPVRYVSPAGNSLEPSIINGNTLTWNIVDFNVIDFDTSLAILVRTDTLARMNEKACFTVTAITQANGDYDRSNDTLAYCYDIRSSYDPNDKEAYPVGNIDTATKWLSYTIRFQNTGNDYAENVYIMDTLSSYVDVSSFQLLSTSHKATTQINGNGIVKFNFPAIFLPDSNTNEPLSHGYIQYKVKLKDGLPIGTTINNTAYIYFDFNEPVVTNTTVNEVALPNGISGNAVTNTSLNVFPNPAGSILNIVPVSFVPEWISIYDVNGKEIMHQKIARQIDISQVHTGMYFIEVYNKNALARTRFMKIK